ncbi:hypothetical protein ACLOJK_041203 [Asimina triloba]
MASKKRLISSTNLDSIRAQYKIMMEFGGWVSVTNKKSTKVVSNLPDSVGEWKTRFFFVGDGGPDGMEGETVRHSGGILPTEREGIRNPQEATLAPLPMRVIQAEPLGVEQSAEVYTKIKEEVTEEKVHIRGRRRVSCKLPLKGSVEEEVPTLKKGQRLIKWLETLIMSSLLALPFMKEIPSNLAASTSIVPLVASYVCPNRMEEEIGKHSGGIFPMERARDNFQSSLGLLQEAASASLLMKVIQAKPLGIEQSVEVNTEIEEEVVEEKVRARGKRRASCKRPLEGSAEEEGSTLKKGQCPKA